MNIDAFRSPLVPLGSEDHKKITAKGIICSSDAQCGFIQANGKLYKISLRSRTGQKFDLDTTEWIQVSQKITVMLLKKDENIFDNVKCKSLRIDDNRINFENGRFFNHIDQDSSKDTRLDFQQLKAFLYGMRKEISAPATQDVEPPKVESGNSFQTPLRQTTSTTDEALQIGQLATDHIKAMSGKLQNINIKLEEMASGNSAPPPPPPPSITVHIEPLPESPPETPPLIGQNKNSSGHASADESDISVVDGSSSLPSTPALKVRILNGDSPDLRAVTASAPPPRIEIGLNGTSGKGPRRDLLGRKARLGRWQTMSPEMQSLIQQRVQPSSVKKPPRMDESQAELQVEGVRLIGKSLLSGLKAKKQTPQSEQAKAAQQAEMEQQKSTKAVKQEQQQGSQKKVTKVTASAAILDEKESLSKAPQVVRLQKSQLISSQHTSALKAKFQPPSKS